jgi:hypothetical protein
MSLRSQHLSTVHLRRQFGRLVWGGLLFVLALSACQAQSWRPPAEDLVRFEPVPKEKRIFEAPFIKLMVHKDAHEFCFRITGQAINKKQKPMACAYWNTRRNECTIVIPAETSTNYIGHELRHCFEGAYHP